MDLLCPARDILLGPASVQDSRAAKAEAADTVDEDLAEGEVINWSAMDVSLLSELCHRFRPRLVVLLTASCPTYTHFLITKKIPCVALCFLA